MAEVSSKASPLKPIHCYRVVIFNVSEVQFGESKPSFFGEVCRTRKLGGAGVDEGHQELHQLRPKLKAMIKPPD